MGTPLNAKLKLLPSPATWRQLSLGRPEPTDRTFHAQKTSQMGRVKIRWAQSRQQDAGGWGQRRGEWVLQGVGEQLGGSED